MVSDGVRLAQWESRELAPPPTDRHASGFSSSSGFVAGMFASR